MATFSRSATLEWSGDVVHGVGQIVAGNGSFGVSATFPRLSGERGATTPEEMLAASHAICIGIGLRSVIARRGGAARRVVVTATVTAEKAGGVIRILSSRLECVIEGPEQIDPGDLQAIARETELACTISNAIRGNVEIEVAISTRA